MTMECTTNLPKIFPRPRSPVVAVPMNMDLRCAAPRPLFREESLSSCEAPCKAHTDAQGTIAGLVVRIPVEEGRWPAFQPPESLQQLSPHNSGQLSRSRSRNKTASIGWPRTLRSPTQLADIETDQRKADLVLAAQYRYHSPMTRPDCAQRWQGLARTFRASKRRREGKGLDRRVQLLLTAWVLLTIDLAVPQ